MESPVISGCPNTQSGNTDRGFATGTVSWTAPTATDNSGTQTLTSTHNPGDSFPIGTTPVTYTSTDATGNTATCTFDVVVTGEFLQPIMRTIYQDFIFLMPWSHIHASCFTRSTMGLLTSGSLSTLLQSLNQSGGSPEPMT